MRARPRTIMSRAAARARIDYAFHMIFGESSIASIKQELPGLMEDGYLSVKVFMNYAGFMLDDERILTVMDITRRHGGLTMVHAENGRCVHWLSDKLAQAPGGCLARRFRRDRAGAGRAGGHPPRDNPRAARRCACSAGPCLGGRSTEQIRWAHDRGMPILAETCPQYLVRTVERSETPGWEAAKFLCSPPLQRRARRGGALAGIVRTERSSLFSSDHCPFRIEGPDGSGPGWRTPHFRHVAPGLPGIETRLMLLFQRGGRQRPHHAPAIRRADLHQSGAGSTACIRAKEA